MLLDVLVYLRSVRALGYLGLKGRRHGPVINTVEKFLNAITREQSS